MTSDSATSQYHAQLYSGQKQLQKRHQQQQEHQTFNSSSIKANKPTQLNYKVLSFEAPNLYHTSLQLTTEIDIHAWWASLVKIFSGTSFHATRIALSIPQDSNDPFNGPWGLKAVYNKTGSISQENIDLTSVDSSTEEYNTGEKEDDSNYDYFLHGHSVHETFPRHLPWCFDRLQPFESEPEPLINNPSVNRILKRNAPVVLSREYRRKSTSKRQSEDFGVEIFKRALLDQTSEKSRKSNWTLPIITTPCLSKDEILVDGSALLLIDEEDDNSSNSKSKSTSNDSILSNNNNLTPGGGSITSNTTATPGSTFLQDYDEYEQQQPSPWSQSPAPSPAIMDPEINPFFQSPPDIDDEAFNPVSPESYDNTSVPFPPPISNVHSVVHIPLFHPLGSIDHISPNVPPPQSQHHHLFNTYLNNNNTTNNTSTSSNNKQQPLQQNYPIPIAILSFLAPIVPYPPILLSSIASLAPFISASFTNANENAQFKKQGQFHHSRRKDNVNNMHDEDHHLTTESSFSNKESRPKNYRRKSSKSKLKKQQSHDSGGEDHEYEDDRIDDSGNDGDEFLLQQQQQQQQQQLQFDSASTTPTAGPNSCVHEKRPDHLGSMSNFTRSSLETVTEHYDPPSVHPQQSLAETTTDISSLYSYSSSFSSAPAELVHNETSSSAPNHDIMPPVHRKRSSQTSITSTTSSHKEQRRLSQSRSSHVSLSPSSVAVIEGWGAVSPTTGLPISASIPPHTMCSDKTCVKHGKLDMVDIDIDDTDDENDDLAPKTTETEDYSEQPLKDRVNFSKSKHNNRCSLLKRPRRRGNRRPRYRVHGSGSSNKSLTRKVYDDDGFHYHRQPQRHHQNRSDIDRFLVAPKSSLLRLIIDGIPIHVFTCSTSSGQVTWVNNRMLQYTGRSLKDHLGPKWLSHMHPDDQPECKKAWELAYEQGNGFAGEYRLRRFDGIYRCFLWRIVPLRDLKGHIIHWFGTCTDVHDQHVAKESSLRQVEIESNERKYRLLAEAIPQIVFTFSPVAGLTYTNGKWSSYSGKSFEQTMGLGFMSCVHPEDRAKLQLPDLPLLNKAGVSWQSEVRLLSAQEEYRWFLVKCVSVDELDTGEVRWFGTCTDINDQKLLEQKLKEAHDAAQKSTESKTRFLSNMSHEIRTPLIGITGMLNFLLDTELTAEQMDYVHTIQQSAESLLVVINDILDLSKVEAGMMKLEWEPFSLVTMIEDANELLSTLAIQKDLELSFWVDDDVPDVVIGDRVRLRQVMLNLIGNAIKFTSVGEVFTKCTVQQCDQDDSSELTLLFEVVDTGTGFDASEESVMFKPFSQVDSSSTRKHGGSGLGLVISRQLIELHGGTMKCKSEKGKGSTFYFTAKFGIPTAQTRPLPQTPRNDSSHDPFFRSNGYGNDNTAQAIVEKQEEIDASPVLFVNSNQKQRFIPSPSDLASGKHSQSTNDSSPAELLQDVLMTKAASMQLKPPPIRNPTTAAMAAVAAAATAATNLGNKTMLSSLPTTTSKEETNLTKPPVLVTKALEDLSHSLSRSSSKSSDHRIPTIGTGPGLSSSPHGVVILPPRTPTRSSPLRALIVSQWEHSRESMVKHVKSILGSLVNTNTNKNELDTASAGQNTAKPSHYQIDTLTNQIEATEWLTDPHTPPYDYIMVNLPSDQQILSLTRTICGSMQQQMASVLVVTTPMQRSLITESAKGREDQVIPHTCGFVFKPLKRTKLRWYFGVRQQTETKIINNVPATQSSAVSTPDTPYRRAATQKEIFRKMEADVGGKGFKVLLVEDNLVNQKVLTRYLTRVGLEVDVAEHGGECIDMFFKYPKDYYSLILCDLFMPVKDGYETTREIREWEKNNLRPNDVPTPIVALSANVMSDVANKCLECGFSTYISKPVNFAILSDVIRGYLLK